MRFCIPGPKLLPFQLAVAKTKAEFVKVICKNMCLKQVCILGTNTGLNYHSPPLYMLKHCFLSTHPPLWYYDVHSCFWFAPSMMLVLLQCLLLCVCVCMAATRMAVSCGVDVFLFTALSVIISVY